MAEIFLHSAIIYVKASIVWHHPFMTSTQRGSGSDGRLHTGKGDKRHVDVHTEN